MRQYNHESRGLLYKIETQIYVNTKMNPVALNYIALTSIRDIISTRLTVRPLSTDGFERGERIMLDIPSGKCYVTSGNQGQADDKVDSLSCRRVCNCSSPSYGCPPHCPNGSLKDLSGCPKNNATLVSSIWTRNITVHADQLKPKGGQHL